MAFRSYIFVVTGGHDCLGHGTQKKNRENLRKHRISFETAQLVWDDPHAASRLDPYQLEERWQTIGKIGNVTVLIVHTPLELNPAIGEEVGRIISARKATRHERKVYEEGDF
jgi:uncharacterized DUF497 family protein